MSAGHRGDLSTVGEQARGLHFTVVSYRACPPARTTVIGAGGFDFRDPIAPWDMAVEGRLTGRLVDVGEADIEAIDRAGDVTGAIAVLAPRDWSGPAYPPGEQMTAGFGSPPMSTARRRSSCRPPCPEDPRRVDVPRQVRHGPARRAAAGRPLRPAAGRPQHGGFPGTVGGQGVRRAPAGARDADGNSVVATVIRAYALK